MNKTLIAAVIVVALAPVGASAQERVGDAALGAASGLILGPVGVVAGAVVGYTVGPNIASAWGIRRSQRVHRTRTHAARRTTARGTSGGEPAELHARGRFAGQRHGGAARRTGGCARTCAGAGPGLRVSFSDLLSAGETAGRDHGRTSRPSTSCRGDATDVAALGSRACAAIAER